MKRKYTLRENNISVNVKLSALWASFMFLYIYVDYFALYMPQKIEHIEEGRIFVFDITQGFLFTALVLVSIPALMIFLSVLLPTQINRWINIIVSIFYIPFTLFNLSGEAWPHMIFAALIEVIILSLIIRIACKWPRIEL